MSWHYRRYKQTWALIRTVVRTAPTGSVQLLACFVIRQYFHFSVGQCDVRIPFYGFRAKRMTTYSGSEVLESKTAVLVSDSKLKFRSLKCT